MQVKVIHKQKESERHAEYRREKGTDYRTQNRDRMRKSRAAALPEFIAVDSEGVGRGKNHRAVLIGVGEKQYISRNTHIGLQWRETFEFLYQCFEQKPHAAYVGFYLSYDFNQWLKSLPEQSAWYLLSPKGKEMRHMKNSGAKRRTFYPVRLPGWEIDMLGFKRLSIRPRVCQCAELKTKCVHQQKPWMHICDAGSFFQMSFASLTHPDMWKDDPDGPICTPAEWKKLFAGKERRATAKLDKKMMEYNVLENILLARVMDRLAAGFVSMGIRLAKDQWYGPGASASKWLTNHGTQKNRDLIQLVPDWFLDVCCKSYFGGWFEIFSHGIIKGETYNYDINNAYPYATTKLPHICSECRYDRGNGAYKGSGKYVLVRATVQAKGNRIGPVPYRDHVGSILRPARSTGWYWLHEIDAATSAKLVATTKTEYHEWVEFIPCNHPEPFTEVGELYERRLKVGKNSAQGLSIKLNNNSLYGKFAQSTGAAPFNNWLYASYITSHCRTQILNAIATHPRKADAVLMVATDGILFDSPHPTLPCTKRLGEWDHAVYTDVCLYKPGVYWHRAGKEALLKIKSRGVPKAEFASGIEIVETQFQIMLDRKAIPGDPIVPSILYHEHEDIWLKMEAVRAWPWFDVPVKFRMKSCKAALNEGEWSRAAVVQEEVWVKQDSDPHSKRTRPTYNRKMGRIDTHIHILPTDKIQTKYYGEVHYPVGLDDFNFEGPADRIYKDVGMVLQSTHARYDPRDYEWDMVWEGKEI